MQPLIGFDALGLKNVNPPAVFRQGPRPAPADSGVLELLFFKGSGWIQHPGWPGLESGQHRFQHPAPGFASSRGPDSHPAAGFASGPRPGFASGLRPGFASGPPARTCIRPPARRWGGSTVEGRGKRWRVPCVCVRVCWGGEWWRLEGRRDKVKKNRGANTMNLKETT